MSEHTPGEWQAVPLHVHNDGTMDEMDGLGWDIEGPEQPMRGQFSKAADAKVAAAGPKLLAACEFGDGNRIDTGPGMLRYAADRLELGFCHTAYWLREKADVEEAAIAKAKGETHG